MKLIRFSQGDSKPRFGVVIGDRAIAFATLRQRSGITQPDLSDSQAYLAGLPDNERAARELAAWGEAQLDEWPEGEKPRLQDVRLHEPVEVMALFDFGLTPRHLKNSADTLMKRSQRGQTRRRRGSTPPTDRCSRAVLFAGS
jgi:hypothetical protein